MSIYPTVRPSLTLDFQKSKQLDPRISFSRSSSATYVEGGVVKTADEHQARFEDEGLLIEESRINVVKANTTGSDAGWDYGEESTEVQPPTGGTDSVRKGDSLRLKNNNLTAPSGTYQAWITMFVNTASWSRFAFRTVTGGNYYFFFDLSGPTPRVEEKQGNNIITDVNPNKYICQQLANGWWRIGYRSWNTTYLGYRQLWRFDWDANDEPIIINNFPAGAPANTFIYAWGGQMEIGANASSFIPNNGTNSITRAADVCKIEGDNFSSWYNPNKGALVLDMKRTPMETFNVFLCTSGGGYFLSDIAGTMRLRNFTGGVYDFGTITTDCKIASSYLNGTGFNTSFNGSVAGAVSDTNTFAGSQLEIGGGSNAYTSFWRSGNSTLTVARLSYYSEQLTDAQLKVLTS